MLVAFSKLGFPNHYKCKKLPENAVNRNLNPRKDVIYIRKVDVGYTFSEFQKDISAFYVFKARYIETDMMLFNFFLLSFLISGNGPETASHF